MILWALTDIFSIFVAVHKENKENMRSIPTITKNLLIINILMFIATFVFDKKGIDLNEMLGLHFFLAPDYNILQLFSYMFMHANLEHIFFNMFALWMFGCVIEQVWGPKKFFFYYIACGVGAGLIQEISQFTNLLLMNPDLSISEILQGAKSPQNAMLLNMWTTVGASGSIYAILLAFGMTFPENRIFIFPLPIPIKAKWFITFYIGLELLMALGTTGDNVAHFAHLGGMLFGFIMIRYWNNHNNHNSFNSFKGDTIIGKWKNKFDNKNRKDFYDEKDADRQYNADKKKHEEEIDKILDKVRRSGYESLSKEEKEKLFDNK